MPVLTTIVRCLVGAVVPMTGFAAEPAMAAASGFGGQPVFAEATIETGHAPSPPLPDGTTGPFTPAPVPDLDRQAPLALPAGPSQAHLAPRLYNRRQTYSGEGYVFGSTSQPEEDKRARPAPGINLTMPLQ